MISPFSLFLPSEKILKKKFVFLSFSSLIRFIAIDKFTDVESYRHYMTMTHFEYTDTDQQIFNWPATIKYKLFFFSGFVIFLLFFVCLNKYRNTQSFAHAENISFKRESK